MARQVSLQVTPEFEQELATIMQARGVASATEAIQQVVHEVAAKIHKPATGFDWAGFGSPLPEDPSAPPFDDDEIWEGSDPDVDDKLLEKRRRAVQEMRTLYPDLHGLHYGREEKEEMFRGMDV